MDELHPVIEQLLGMFREELGNDYQRYSNHVYRVYYNCRFLDNNAANEEKYAIAATFHDIGIWTHRTLDYVDPSIEEAETWLTENSRPELVEEVAAMINCHHTANQQETGYAATAEIFRRADWMDITLGIHSYGVNRKLLKENRRKRPTLGFHLFLVRKSLQYVLTHPFHPFPLFR